MKKRESFREDGKETQKEASPSSERTTGSFTRYPTLLCSPWLLIEFLPPTCSSLIRGPSSSECTKDLASPLSPPFSLPTLFILGMNLCICACEWHQWYPNLRCEPQPSQFSSCWSWTFTIGYVHPLENVTQFIRKHWKLGQLFWVSVGSKPKQFHSSWPNSSLLELFRNMFQ